MSGAVTASFAYDAWGRRTAGFGSQADPSGESIFGDAFGNLGRGASWGTVKRGNPGSWWTFWGEQLGGIADPLRKMRAAGAAAGKADEVVEGIGSLLKRLKNAIRDETGSKGRDMHQCR